MVRNIGGFRRFVYLKAGQDLRQNFGKISDRLYIIIPLPALTVRESAVDIYAFSASPEGITVSRRGIRYFHISIFHLRGLGCKKNGKFYIRFILVCAYNDEEEYKRINLEGSISLTEFYSKLPQYSKDQEIIFF